MKRSQRSSRLRAEPRVPAHLYRGPLVDRWVQPFARFFQIEASSGFLLLICALLAISLANSQWADAFEAIWQTELSVSLGPLELRETLRHWITEGLMTIFFFIVGLEIKRELVAGELRDPRKAALPVMAAIGGMVVPAAVYLAILSAGAAPELPESAMRGWGIPIATDIAFVVVLLSMFGSRVPPGLKIFVLSLAIADDIGAVLVIALFFTTEVSFGALGFAAIGLVAVFLLNRIGVRRVPIYVFVGALIWLAFLQSGVHPTLAGVLLGLLTPASAWIGDQAFLDVVTDALERLRRGARGSAGKIVTPRQRQRSLGQIATSAHESVSPLERLEFALHPWVAFGIVPLFALSNAGVPIEPFAVQNNIALGVALGLFAGKPLGVMLFSFLAVRTGLARLPAGVNWRIMLGASCLAGIGFTMSLLIAALALDGIALEAGKIGTLIGSALSAIAGSIMLMYWLPHTARRA